MGLKMTARDGEIRQAQEHARHNDTLILQKINASHRIAFQEKFPGQIEHILRLLTERLQAGLDKRDNVVLEDVSTWKLTPAELHDLASAIRDVFEVRQQVRVEDAINRSIDG